MQSDDDPWPDEVAPEDTDVPDTYKQARERGLVVGEMVCLGCGWPIVSLPTPDSGAREVPDSPVTVLKPCGHHTPGRVESVGFRSFDHADRFVAERVTPDTDPGRIKWAQAMYAVALNAAGLSAALGGSSLPGDPSPEPDPPADADDPDEEAETDDDDDETRRSIPEKGTLKRLVLDVLADEGPSTAPEMEQRFADTTYSSGSVQSTLSALATSTSYVEADRSTSPYTYRATDEWAEALSAAAEAAETDEE